MRVSFDGQIRLTFGNAGVDGILIGPGGETDWQ